jgi:hypothetical protein
MRLLQSIGSVVALLACATGAGRSAVSAPATPSLVTTLVPTNASGNRIVGTVRLTSTDKPGEWRARIEIRGGNFQNRFPWMVRVGQCGEKGEDVGTPVNYRNIETSADGTARLTAPVKITIPEGVTHHVDIMASPTDRETIVSCGVLSPEG